MMMNPESRNSTRSTCLGSGLLTLDLVMGPEESFSPRLQAGGSCGNVMAILAYLGWLSFPVARLGNDAAGKAVRNDLEKFGVRTDYVHFDARVPTPIIVERLGYNRSGTMSHHFEWKCPFCGSWLPRFRPVLLQMAKKVIEELSTVNCFYFDRATAATLELARQIRARGALIFFEPSSKNRDKNFRLALELAHIVKYSHERLDETEVSGSSAQPQLLVETLGADGLRYQFSPERRNGRNWKFLSAHNVKGFRDACGAGDWCSAGIIYLLGQKGCESLRLSEEDQIREALQFGQALAALNCCFEGARGGMYEMNKQEFGRFVDEFKRHTRHPSFKCSWPTGDAKNAGRMTSVCPKCGPITQSTTKKRRLIRGSGL